MASVCIRVDCARNLAGTVRFCPYCGTAQQVARKPVRVRSTPQQLDGNAVKRHTSARPPAKTTALPSQLPAGQGEAPNFPLQQSATTFASQDANQNSSRPAEAGKGSRRLLALMLVLLALVVGGTVVQRKMPSLAYALTVVPCGDQIDSELTVLVDLPGKLSESGRLEMRARLERLVGEAHAGVRRANVFVTWPVPGDAGRPLLSMCTARSPLAWLLPLRQNDPQIKTRFLGAIFTSEKPRNTQHVALTQVVSDISSSQFLRAPANKLAVFSTMIEQSPRFSLLACQDVDETIRTYREARAGGVQRPAFRNTSIELDVVPDVRVTRAVASCREQFWNWYFGDFEGEGTHLSRDYLPGAAQPT
jgi:hypothetical protein